ncbi:hypothetical protein Pr1d_23510 [Bythopirellula goksoeyrii]|uniref:Chromosome partition protein Smc n=1 Tax=Bythopirellula goksoeyrii TaxID=1400387 RepID=A0A5B9QBV1_9BACT|nr:hypothetical protein Pr1d_23510 [Bythopirellula goksoeyrii]
MSVNARSGRSVGHAIQQAVSGVNNHLLECQSAMNQHERSMSELVERRGQSLLHLAQHYLPNIDQQTIAGSFGEVRNQLADILGRKQRHEREIERTLQADAAEESRLETELEEITERLNEKVARREELEKVVAQRLETDEEFQRLSKEALIAEKELNRNEQRVAEIQSEAAEKLPSYEKSRLFKYLHDRAYGTSEYMKTGLTKTLDGWVAKMIKYPRARRSYDFLRVTPELVAQEVIRRRDQFNGLMEQVEAIEDRYDDEVGLTTVMREGQEVGDRRDRVVAAISNQQALTDKHRQELITLEGSQNEYYQEAVSRMKVFLSNLEDWRLENASRSTPEPDDDEIVAEIVRLGKELNENKQEASKLTHEHQVWRERTSDLQAVWQQFHRGDFDSSRSYFPYDFSIESYLEEFVRGRIDRDQLWSAIRSAQEFAPPWYDQPPTRRDRHYQGDFSHVLMRVLLDIAGQALENAARRGMQRRSPIRQEQRRQKGRPGFSSRGFTDGRGF